MSGVTEVFEFLGYNEIRFQGERWKSLSESNGAHGTIDDTYVI